MAYMHDTQSSKFEEYMNIDNVKYGVSGTEQEPVYPIENKIREKCQDIADFLVEKNRSYGSAVEKPIGIFAKRVDALTQIDVRIDDKLKRLIQGHEYIGDDTVIDLVGYLILRIVVSEKLGKEER